MTMGFAFSRLTALARARGRGAGSDMPVLRRADAHPDAPARRPIFASSDFAGNDIFSTQPVQSAVPELEALPVMEEAPEPIFDFASLSMPRSPDPMDEDDVIAAAPLPLDVMPHDERIAGFAPLAAPVPPADMERPIAFARNTSRPPVDGLTITELAERFERGLARLGKERISLKSVVSEPAPSVPQPRVLADIPPAPSVATKADVDAEVEQALRDALATLQKMSAR
jgi:hypothetical protein